MLGNYKIVASVMTGALLCTGCMMNQEGVIKAQPQAVADTWNDDVNSTDPLQRFLYHTNQFFVNDNIHFHEHVQSDMGLSPGGIWYPTEEMAEGEVPFYPSSCTPCQSTAYECTAQPDPAKVDSNVDYHKPAPAAKPITPKRMPAPAPRAGEGEIDYNMLQRSIK